MEPLTELELHEEEHMLADDDGDCGKSIELSCQYCERDHPEYVREGKRARGLYEVTKGQAAFYKEEGIDIVNSTSEDVEKLRRLK